MFILLQELTKKIDKDLMKLFVNTIKFGKCKINILL